MSTNVMQSIEASRIKSGRAQAPPRPGVVPRASFVLDYQAHVVSVMCDAANVSAFNAVTGRPFSECIERPSAAELRGLLRRARDGAPVHTPVRFKGQDGSSALSSQLYIIREGANFQALWIESANSAESSEPKPVEFGSKSLLFVRLFHAYLQLEETNRRKAAMLAASTHEVKTPLAIMNGAAEMLASERLGPLNPAQVEVIALFQQNCLRLMNIVNCFLNYAAAESGSGGLQLNAVSVGELQEQAAKLWKNVAKTRGLTFKTKITDGLPPVPCDREKVLAVINTLCDNAINFTPRGGTVELTAEGQFWERRLTLRVPSSERRKKAEYKINSVLVSVSDNGVGIPPEFHNEIFDPFFRAPNGQSSPGVGLGLAIARDLVSAHGGKIWVDSQPGEGSSFHVLLHL